MIKMMYKFYFRIAWTRQQLKPTFSQTSIATDNDCEAERERERGGLATEAHAFSAAARIMIQLLIITQDLCSLVTLANNTENCSLERLVCLSLSLSLLVQHCTLLPAGHQCCMSCRSFWYWDYCCPAKRTSVAKPCTAE